MAQPGCVCVNSRPKHRSMFGWRHSANLSVRNLWPQRISRSRVLLERLLPHKMVSLERAGETSFRSPILQCLQSPQFWPTEPRVCWHSRQTFDAEPVRRIDVYDLPTYRFARSRPRWRQLSLHDRISGAIGVLRLSTVSTTGGDTTLLLNDDSNWFK